MDIEKIPGAADEQNSPPAPAEPITEPIAEPIAESIAEPAAEQEVGLAQDIFAGAETEPEETAPDTQEEIQVEIQDSIVPDAPDSADLPAPFAPARARFAATVSVTGAFLPAGLFRFAVFDKKNTELSRASNDKFGGVVFPEIQLSEPGEYVFSLRAMDQSGGGWSIDRRTWAARVTVSDTGGSLTAETDYPGGPPAFVNRYQPPRRRV